MLDYLWTLFLPIGNGNTVLIPTTLGSIVIHAIRSLSPLLPLLTTGLCEDRVVRALDLGLLYPAAAPMSIFGCLGIAKAGFIALCASIDCDFFDGPALLRNAGIQVSGIGELLLHVKESKDHLYLAEDRLRTILSKKKVRSVKVNMGSPDFLGWNRRLLQWTIFLNIFGVIPYIPLFVFSLPDRPFQETWLYPILRISGSALVAISLQLLFQLRLLEEVYHRLRFLAADNFLKDNGKSLPPFWDHNQRSRDTFLQLKRSMSTPTTELPDAQDLTEEDGNLLLRNIDALSSFDFASPTYPSPSHPQTPPATYPTFLPGTASSNPYERPTTQSGSLSRQTTRVDEAAHLLDTSTQQDDAHSPRHPPPYATLVLLPLTQVLLFAGVICIILGYIGCFGVVLASGHDATWWGPLFWLLFEGLLALIRVALWASNPPWDDPRSPIVLEKQPRGVSVGGDPNQCSYGIGWGLNSLTADDMHALIIGINTYPGRTGFQDLRCAKQDGERVANYLEETLMVPCGQICTLYNEDATKERIVEELKALRHRGSVVPSAPIVVYFAGHSVQDGDDTYLVPYLPNVQKRDKEEAKRDMLAYSELVDLLSHIGNEKSENIVVIFDTCHAGALGINKKFTSWPSPAPSFPSSSKIAESEEPSSFAENSGQIESPVSRLSIDTSQLPSNTAPGIGGNALLNIPPQSTVATISDGTSLAPRRQDTGELFIGYSSHILLAGTSPQQQCHETETGEGGVFTTTLLRVLQEADQGSLKEMTYKALVEEIRKRFRQHTVPAVLQDGTMFEAVLHNFQSVCCTTIHQKRLLFDGLFARKRDEKSSSPLVHVLYTD